MLKNAYFDEVNKAKINLDHIYNQRDPRAYFSALSKIGYVLPDLAKPLFERLITLIEYNQHSSVRILDLGCSYGVNAALLKYDVSMELLHKFWNESNLACASDQDLIADGQEYFSNLERLQNIEIIGLDKAENAIEFAKEIGLIHEGFTANLEQDPLPKHTKDTLQSIDLVISTGCVGYITEKSFDRLLPTITRTRKPWIANFVLRSFPFDGIEKCLDRWGYVTEKLQGQTFLQRCFVSTTEKEQMIAKLCDLGLDPTGLEDEGHLLAEFYLSRPVKEAAARPIEAIFGKTCEQYNRISV